MALIVCKDWVSGGACSRSCERRSNGGMLTLSQLLTSGSIMSLAGVNRLESCEGERNFDSSTVFGGASHRNSG